jgi:haloacetate dehalogenase
MFEGFSDQKISLSTGIQLRVRVAGSGPAILLLHGYPQTHVCWHKVAPKLVEEGFTVVLSDLRGYGDSDKPPSDEMHNSYSKRVMAADQSEMMQQLGFNTFGVAGHDRGARVAHRLARDYTARVKALAVLDIAPTAHMYAQTERVFATGYYHWFFLIQPAPLPERLIGNDPEFYLRSKISAWSKGNVQAFSEGAMTEYVRCFKDKDCISATCEDYRAAAGIDLEHDLEDKDAKLTMPVLVLWGAKGLVGKLYDVLNVWEKYANRVEGAALPCGHFLPEEKPEETSAALIEFFQKHFKN